MWWFIACGPAEPERVVGAAEALGGDEVAVWVELDDGGAPASIGVSFSGTGGWPAEAASVDLTIPPEAEATGFDHVGVDWQPGGHLPPGVWDAPHVDVHFYRVSVETRAGYVEGDAMDARPADPYVPAGYVTIPGTGEPGMGAHWWDPEAPEWNDGEFTASLLYGSYDAELVFVEPMVTRALLEGAPDVSASIPWPELWAAGGAWPRGYAVTAGEAGAVEVAITGLETVTPQ